MKYSQDILKDRLLLSEFVVKVNVTVNNIQNGNSVSVFIELDDGSIISENYDADLGLESACTEALLDMILKINHLIMMRKNSDFINFSEIKDLTVKRIVFSDNEENDWGLIIFFTNNTYTAFTEFNEGIEGCNPKAIFEDNRLEIYSERALAVMNKTKADEAKAEDRIRLESEYKRIGELLWDSV